MCVSLPGLPASQLERLGPGSVRMRSVIVVRALPLEQPSANASLIKQGPVTAAPAGKGLALCQLLANKERPGVASKPADPTLTQARSNGLLAEDTSAAPRSPRATSCGVFLRSQPCNGLPIVARGRRSGCPGQATSGRGPLAGQAHLERGAPARRVSADHGGSGSRTDVSAGPLAPWGHVPALVCPVAPTADRRGQGEAHVRTGWTSARAPTPRSTGQRAWTRGSDSDLN